MKTIGLDELLKKIHSLEAENERLISLVVAQETTIRERDDTIGRCLRRGIRLRDVLVSMRDNDHSRQDIVNAASKALDEHDAG